MKLFHRSKKKTKILQKLKQQHGFWFYFIGFLIFLFALNVALLPLNQISSLLYEVEIWLISFLRMPIRSQLWFTILILGLVWILGYILTPVLSIPSTGEWFIVLRRWQENELVYYKTLGGTVIATHYSNTSRKGMHHFIYDRVVPMWYQGKWLYQTIDLEALKNEIAQNVIEVLSNQVAILEESEANREPKLTIEEIKRLMSKGGEEE